MGINNQGNKACQYHPDYNLLSRLSIRLSHLSLWERKLNNPNSQMHMQCNYYCLYFDLKKNLQSIQCIGSHLLIHKMSNLFYKEHNFRQLEHNLVHIMSILLLYIQRNLLRIINRHLNWNKGHFCIQCRRIYWSILYNY